MTVVPPYLRDALTEAAEYYENNDDVTAVDAAYEVAHQNEALIRMGDGEHNTFGVLQDLHHLNTLCGDEFETYREYRMADYPESILEALALRSLEEFIATHLSKEQEIAPAEIEQNREIEYINVDDEQAPSFIEVHVTAKEAVDIENAIQNLLTELADNHPRRDQAEQYNRLWKGGISGLNDTSFVISTTTDATILLEALTRHEPRETDYTTRIRHAILEAINGPKSPIDSNDIEKFTESAPTTTAD